MSFWEDAIEWGADKLYGGYEAVSGVIDYGADVAGDAYDYLFDPAVEHPIYGRDPGGVLTQAYDYTTDLAGDAWDWLQGSDTAAGVGTDLAKSFLGLDEDGRPINLPEFQRSQARTGVAQQGQGPSLYDMGYTPRAISKAQAARNSSNRYVQNALNLVGRNIEGRRTITLEQARLPSAALYRKYTT